MVQVKPKLNVRIFAQNKNAIVTRWSVVGIRGVRSGIFVEIIINIAVLAESLLQDIFAPFQAFSLL
jgi:hypothetical protein